MGNNNKLPNMLESKFQQRLESLREKIADAKRCNDRDVTEDNKRQRSRNQAYKTANPELQETSTSIERSILDYSLKEWERFEERKPGGGYKNLNDLAYATYKKELNNMKPDKEKYANSKDSKGDLFLVNDDSEDINRVVKALHESSKNKLKRKRADDDGEAFITEKNRQFNMKLEREYGKQN